MKYNEYMYVKMNFGKYKGQFLKDVPDDYIVWAIKNLEDVGIATMFSIEYQRRHKQMRKNK
jgi:uncharacterized protein (DUF3820 family)